MRNSVKIIKRIISLMLVVTMLSSMVPSYVYAADSNGVPTTDDANKIKLNEWLKYMPDDMPVSRINMLASHDAGCYNPAEVELVALMFPILSAPLAIFAEFGREVAKTQDKTITEQLENGVRVFDIRGGYELVNSPYDPLDMVVNHGGMPMVKNKHDLVFPFLTIGDTINEIDNFLKDHPTETVIVNFDHEEIPISDLIKEQSKFLLKKLIEQFPKASQMGHYSSRFFYFEKGSEVPTLGDVRGKCIVLNAQDKSLTSYENNWSVSAYKKRDFVSHFFESHNSSDGLIKYSNKTGLYKKDHFIKEDSENGTDNENDPQVKMVNYSANEPPISLPPIVAALVKPEYSKAKYFKSETRYGWIGNDFIGLNDPTDAIIYSNVGCTNFYANIDTNDVLYEATNLMDYVIYGEYGGNKVEFPLLHSKNYKVELTHDGKKIQIKAIGLPLYAPNGERYKYKLEMTNEIYALEESSSEVDSRYSISDDKWCGQKVYASYKAKKNITEIPLEIEWNVDEEVKENPDFKIPKNHSEFFKIIDSLVYKQTTETGGEDEIRLYGFFDTDANVHLGEFEKIDDELELYKTSVVNLPKNSNKGEDYSYKLNKAVIRNQGQKGYYIGTSIEDGDGCERLVVSVKAWDAKVEVPGKIIWRDLGNLASKRDDAFASMFYPVLEIDKYEDAHSKHMIENIDKPFNEQENEKDTEFSSLVNKMHPSGVEYDRYEYKYPDKLLYDKDKYNKYTSHQYLKEDWEPGYYRKISSDVSKNQVTYELHVKADVKAVFNTATSTELSDLGIGDKLGIKLKTKGGNASYVDIETDDKCYWESGEIADGISIEDAYNSLVDKTYFKSGGAFIDLAETFNIRVGRVVTLDDNGFPFIHYMLYCDSKVLEVKPIYGTVTWIDGGMASHPENEYLDLKVEQQVDGGDWTHVSPADYKIVWEGNAYYVYADADEKKWLPSETEDGEEIEYRIDAPNISGFKLESDEDDLDLKYVKKVNIRVVENGETIESSDVEIYQNGNKVADGSSCDDKPIADDGNIPYEYTAKIDNTDSIVKYLGSKYYDHEDNGLVEIEIATYEPYSDDIKLPVELIDKVKISSESYRFQIEGMTDDGPIVLDKLVLTDNDLEGEFTIVSDCLRKDNYTYRFNISQIVGGRENVEYDEHISTVNVKSSLDDDESKQTISVEWENDDEQAAGASLFENRINYEPVVLELNDLKHESVVRIPDGTDDSSAFPNTFIYELLDKQGEDCYITLDSAEITDVEPGKKAISFTEHPVEYYEPGDYTLYVTCLANTEPGSSGWDYDSILYSIDFKVAPNSDNSGLEIKDITYEKETITQVYSAIDYSISVKHKLEGQADGTEFEFDLEDMFGPFAETKSIIDEGQIDFTEIRYFAPGEYYYRITEKEGTNPEWEYDDTVITYKITVERDAGGYLEITSDDTPTFTSVSAKRHEPLTVQWVDSMETSKTRTYRPAKLKFDLYQNGNKISSVGSISGSAKTNEWRLDKITENPLAHYEMVDGVKTPITYTVGVAGNGADFENNYTTYCFGTGDGTLSILCIQNDLLITGDIDVRVEWDDEDNASGKRPDSVIVAVSPFFADEQTVNADNGWRAGFKDLPMATLDENQKKVPIEYALVPANIDNYDMKVSFDEENKEYVITYTLKDEKDTSSKSKSTSHGDIIQYAIHFETNGGTPIIDYYAVDSEFIELKDYVTKREGFFFAGWHRDKELTEYVDSFTVCGPTNLYAAWGLLKIPLAEIEKQGEIVIPVDDISKSEFYPHEIIEAVKETKDSKDKSVAKAFIEEFGISENHGISDDFEKGIDVTNDIIRNTIDKISLAKVGGIGIVLVAIMGIVIVIRRRKK